MRKIIFLCLVLIIGLLPFATSACSEEPKSITVGCKNFTEQYIIGEMLAQLLTAEGFEVELVSDMSTDLLRSSMEAGDIDIAADYTGTGWMSHLGHEYTPGVDNNEVYDMVKDEDAGNGFTWLDPSGTTIPTCWFPGLSLPRSTI